MNVINQHTINLCPKSKKIWGAVLGCVCVGACATVCTPDGGECRWFGGSTLCYDCMTADLGCEPQIIACRNDR